MFVCFPFYLVLFVFIWNTKRLPQNSLKMKSGMVCGENNITCASELHFLVESKFSCRIRTRNKQTKNPQLSAVVVHEGELQGGTGS